MGLLRNIRKGLSGQGRTSLSATAAIVDTCDLAGRSGRNAGPRERVQMLKKLGDFAEKEGISLTAVVVAPPLREAADGATYRGITVHYAEKGNFPAVIGKVARKASGRSGTVVITSNKEAESEAIAAGAAVMQTATLKKALGGEDDRPGKSDRGGRRRRRRNGNHKPKEKESPNADNPASEEERIIRDLVDPL